MHNHQVLCCIIHNRQIKLIAFYPKIKMNGTRFMIVPQSQIKRVINGSMHTNIAQDKYYTKSLISTCYMIILTSQFKSKSRMGFTKRGYENQKPNRTRQRRCRSSRNDVATLEALRISSSFYLMKKDGSFLPQMLSR